jgi:Amt family ammonium transporter
MSLPGLAVLYGGLVQRKWAVTHHDHGFSGFCLVLIVWVLWVFKMGFRPGVDRHLRRPPRAGHRLAQRAGPGQRPERQRRRADAQFRFPQSALVYFQFVFAAITPLLFLGSVVGRISFKVWLSLRSRCGPPSPTP